MKKTILTSPGDAWILKKYKWCAGRYAYRWGNPNNIYMHREIMNAKNNEYVDHVNGNGLDNRRENLRICTQSQNNMNQKKMRGGSSKYKGVFYRKDTSLWQAYITMNESKHNLGCYSSEEEAATVYNIAAYMFFKEFASPNEVE